MSWFKLNEPVGTSYRLDTNDLMNTKRALNQLGYYNIPPHRGIDDWTDDSMFDGIRRFQKDNNLKVDAFMRPGGPMEKMINYRIQRTSASLFSESESDDGLRPGPITIPPQPPRPPIRLPPPYDTPPVKGSSSPPRPQGMPIGGGIRG